MLRLIRCGLCRRLEYQLPGGHSEPVKPEVQGEKFYMALLRINISCHHCLGVARTCCMCASIGVCASIAGGCRLYTQGSAAVFTAKILQCRIYTSMYC